MPKIAFSTSLQNQKLRVGIYARVSTQDQQTLPLQLEVMRKYAKTRKWPIILEIKDIGSGISERKQRELLMQAARRREIDAVVVWKLDRWGRSLHDLVSTLKELSELEVGFISLTEALDLTTAIGGPWLVSWLYLPSSSGKCLENGSKQALPRRARKAKIMAAHKQQPGTRQKLNSCFHKGCLKQK